jgi:hypothetical protein
VIARVVRKRDDARLAIVTSTVVAVFLGVVLADDVAHLGLFRGRDVVMYILVAAAIALGGIGPWLVWARRRGAATEVRCAVGVVQAGALRIAGDDIRALSVVQAARGRSVAVAHGVRNVTFFEVERAEDAARIADTLGVPSPPLGEVAVREPRRALAIPQALLTLFLLAAAPLYYFAATRGYTTPSIVPDQKALFGLGGVIAVQVSLILLVVRRLAGHAMAIGRGGAWDAHGALHRAETKAEERADEPARIGNLVRGDERVRAWLARIDAIPTEQHAYRGDAMKKDVLWDTLGDDAAPVDARMAAARVLRRRYGEREDALVRVVDDADVRVRVEAACEELEDAERRIETLGPLFRAR